MADDPHFDLLFLEGDTNRVIRCHPADSDPIDLTAVRVGNGFEYVVFEAGDDDAHVVEKDTAVDLLERSTGEKETIPVEESRFMA